MRETWSKCPRKPRVIRSDGSMRETGPGLLNDRYFSSRAFLVMRNTGV